MRRKSKVGFFILCLMAACSDILVEDISDEVVSIVAPADSVSTYDAEQLLLWDPVEGATEYELIIFTPDLARASSIVLDTVISQTSFRTALIPASYEWCVRAGNGAYSTVQTCHKLIVKEDLENGEVILLAPADALSTKTTKQTFLWTPVSGATEYHLTIVSPDLLAVERVVVDEVITKTSFRVELIPGQYEWCVTAGDGTKVTASVCRKLEIAEDEE